jgi:hypothetical protein
MYFWSGREDLNLRPLEPHSSALPDCATPRHEQHQLASMPADVNKRQRSENREPPNIEYRMLNIEGKKLHHWKFLTLDHVFSVIRYSIFKTLEFEGLSDT